MNIKNIFKISIILVILLVSIGSIYASQDFDNEIDFDEDDFDIEGEDIDFDDEDDDLEFGEDDFDWDDDDLEFGEDDFDWDDDDLEFGEDDFDWDDDDLEFGEDDFDWDDDYIDFEDDWDDEYNLTSFEYLSIHMHYYLERYGNFSDEWIDTQEFSEEYAIYQGNSADYKLNESLEGYEYYLKIFNSTYPIFEDYNLTQNETEYLHFMVIYYLNHFGNLSANYTWNKYDEFYNYVPPIFFSDFIYLKFKISSYLEKYGNFSGYWVDTQEFLDEYLIYQDNSADYKLNESLEGYETYLKIFNSINSTLLVYNLTQSEIDYLLFMIIYYLNHFGNVSANYTWNESDEFYNYNPLIYRKTIFTEIACACGSATDFNSSSNSKYNVNSGAALKDSITSHNDLINVDLPLELSWWNILIIIILLLLFMI